MTTAIETWFDGIGKVALTVSGVKAVFAGGRSGLDPNVWSIVDEPLLTTPAITLLYGGADITPGSWERQRHIINGVVWIERVPIDERQSQVLAMVDALTLAFPPHAKAFNVSAELQSLLLTRIEQQTTAFWGDVEFLVLPFTLEAVVNRAATYQPA